MRLLNTTYKVSTETLWSVSTFPQMSYKEIVLNYIKTNDVTYFLRTNIEDWLILRINHRINIVNCFESGFRGHVPIRFSDEIASYDSLKVLNKKTPPPSHHDWVGAFFKNLKHNN